MANMINNPLFQRSLPLLTEPGIQSLQNAKVAVFGLGGVGSYAVEALARSGIGHFELIDKDLVDPSNLNRQLCATHETLGKPKVEIIKHRITQINPEAQINIHQIFYNHEMDLDFLPEDLDYIVDAIDTVKAKINLIVQAQTKQIPIISALGAGNKYDPTAFTICDIFKTYNDPIAKIMRSELKKQNIKEQPVVFSSEKPAYRNSEMIASLAFVPAVSGLICASKVVQDLTGLPGKTK